MLNIIHYHRNGNQAIMLYHLTPIRMAVIKIQQTINAEQAAAKRELSYSVGGMQTSKASMENAV